MKCPYCGHINDWIEDQCLMCGRDIAYLRERVLLGAQFVFLEASEEQPIRVTLMPCGGGEEEERRFTQPSIISRHEYAVKLERQPVAWRAPEPQSWERSGLPKGWHLDEPFEMPGLDFPRLDLMDVTTDRQVYRTGDAAHIFIAAPDAGGQEAELEIVLDEGQVHQARVRLNEAGLHLMRFVDLEEGVYTVRVMLPNQPSAEATCTFTSAVFTPSPLKARLEAHALRGFVLRIVLHVTHRGTAYNGPVELAVHNAGQVPYDGEMEIRDGRLEADLKLEPPLVFGEFRLELTTPEGDMATATSPGPGWQGWDRHTINPLDPPVEAALAPFHGAQGEIRGLHFIHEPEEDTPFALERFVGTEARIEALRDAPLAHLLVFDPISGDHQTLEFQEVKAGDVLRFEVGSPYAVFTLGAFRGRGLPFEAWGVVLRPVDLEASLEMPDRVTSGATFSVRVETDRPAHCLLMVHDPGLDHQKPVTRLARRLFDHIFDATWGLEARRVAQVAWLMWGGAQTVEWRMRLRRMGRPLLSHLRETYEAAVRQARSQVFLIPDGETLPDLAHIELFPVEGRVEVPVQLGDRPGPRRCRAYFFRGHDYVSVSRDIEVA